MRYDESFCATCPSSKVRHQDDTNITEVLSRVDVPQWPCWRTGYTHSRRGWHKRLGCIARHRRAVLVRAGGDVGSNKCGGVGPIQTQYRCCRPNGETTGPGIWQADVLAADGTLLLEEIDRSGAVVSNRDEDGRRQVFEVVRCMFWMDTMGSDRRRGSSNSCQV